MDNKDNKMIWHLKTAKADTPREADISMEYSCPVKKMQYRSKLVIKYLRFCDFEKLQDSKGGEMSETQMAKFCDFEKLQDSKGCGSDIWQQNMFWSLMKLLCQGFDIYFIVSV